MSAAGKMLPQVNESTRGQCNSMNTLAEMGSLEFLLKFVDWIR